MVQYKLIITPDNSYRWHGNHPYWRIAPGLNVPPQWRDVPTCIQEEWLKKIPDQFETVEMGGTKYTLMDDLLLPVGQHPRYILTESDIFIHELGPRRHNEPGIDFLPPEPNERDDDPPPPYRQGHLRRRMLQLDLQLQ